MGLDSITSSPTAALDPGILAVEGTECGAGRTVTDQPLSEVRSGAVGRVNAYVSTVPLWLRLGCGRC